jgi:hypothetical protein
MDLVTIVQFNAALDCGVVELRAVPAAQVLQIIRAVAFENLRVVPADGGVVEDDLATGMTPEDDTLPRQGDNLSRRSTLHQLEDRHNVTRFFDVQVET